MRDFFVSVIIPAYNEGDTVAKVVEATAQIMEIYGAPFEIIVINDGSTDNTEVAALSTHKATVLSNKTNRGKGYCLREALTLAKGNIIVTLDSDGEHKPKEIPDLIDPLLEGNDIVSGSRVLCSNHDVTTKIHRLGNSLFNAAIMALTGSVITDSQTGFRAMKRGALDRLALESDGYEIETEIAVKSLRNGFSFKEVPISIQRREYNISKIRLLSDGRKILTTIIKSNFSPMVIEHSSNPKPCFG